MVINAVEKNRVEQQGILLCTFVSKGMVRESLIKVICEEQEVRKEAMLLPYCKWLFGKRTLKIEEAANARL